MDSGDSTDSLVDEAETYLRRSIECVGDKDYMQTRFEIEIVKLTYYT